MTPTGVINDIRGTGVSRGWRADAAPETRWARRALKQEYEQATDAAGAVEDDRTTGAWLLVGYLVATMSPTLHPHDRGRAVRSRRCMPLRLRSWGGREAGVVASKIVDTL